MTFEEAEREVAEIARGKFYSVIFDRTHFRGVAVKTECKIYLNDKGMYKATTFRAAIDLLKADMAKDVGTEESPQIDDEEGKEKSS